MIRRIDFPVHWRSLKTDFSKDWKKQCLPMQQGFKDWKLRDAGLAVRALLAYR
jgi:hypothetical protein